MMNLELSFFLLLTFNNALSGEGLNGKLNGDLNSFFQKLVLNFIWMQANSIFTKL